MNWGTLSIDASCTRADITYPRDLKLLNKASVSTEKIIDDLCRQSVEFGIHRPRYDRGKARTYSLNVALAEGFCAAVEEEVKASKAQGCCAASAQLSAAQS
jgi:hypothetical protein